MPGSVSRQRRVLILAEGRSADPHYGKTARGVLRYRPEQVVAVLDSTRAGLELSGFPIVGSVADAMRYEPTVALVGVATAGGRFPPAWRELLKTCIESGLDVENGLHEFVTRDDELMALARRPRRRAARPAPAACRSERPDRRQPDAWRDDGLDRRLGLRDREDDGLARARPRGAPTRNRERVRPDRPDRDRDRRLGDLGRRRRVGLPRRRVRAARPRGRRAGRRAALGRRPGLAAPPRLLGRHARADPRQGAARLRPLPPGGPDGRRRQRCASRCRASLPSSSCTSA